MRRFEMVLAAALAVAACETTAPAPPAEVQPAPAAAPAPSVSAERMSEVTRVLASDEFQGRSMGDAGEEKTVAYLIEQFRAAGLEPGGENGGWTQTVPMIRTKLQSPMDLSIRQAGRTTALRFPDDIYLSTVRAIERARIADAPMVFVGYGVTAPERGWDDFKGVDLKGKVAVFLVNDPDFEAAAGEPVAGKFGGQTMTYYGRWTYKFEEAARRGAIAALIVHDTAGAGYGWNVVQSAGGREFQHRPAAGRAAAGPAARLDPGAGRGRDVQARGARSRSAEAAGANARSSSRSRSRQRFGADAGVDLTRLDVAQRARQADRIEISERDRQLWRPLGCLRHRSAGRAGPHGPAGCRRRCARNRGDDRDRSAVRGRAASGTHPGLRRLDGGGARPARLRILCAAPALSARDDGREPDARHAADGGAGQGRRADRPGPERDGGPARRGGAGAGPDDHARRPSRARALLSRRPFLAGQARRSGAARYGAGRRVRPGRGRTCGGRALAQRLHRQLLSPDLRCLVGGLGPARRGAGDGAVLRHRRAARERPGMAEMAPVVRIREGARAKRRAPGASPDRDSLRGNLPRRANRDQAFRLSRGEGANMLQHRRD